jgi:uncharacterized protein YbjT (DUF2867 family)
MILVTGATGLVGGEVLKQAAAAGIPVRALARDPAKARVLKSIAEVVIGDFDDPASLDPAVEGVDAVFMASFDGEQQAALQGNLIAACKGAGVRHVVRLSALTADENTDQLLPRWHGIADRRLAESGLGYTLLKPGWFMQNMLHYALGGTISLPAGDSKSSHIDVRDIAAVAMAALTEPGHEGEAYVLSGPENLTYDEVAEQLTTGTGQPFAYNAISDEAYREYVLLNGYPDWAADMVVELFQRTREGDYSTLTDTVERVTGRPACTVADFARDYAAALVADG